MTHDELLSIMDNYTFKDSAEPVKALRAVVELHYPWEITWAATENFIACYSCAEIYPCPTIEAIIEELS